MKRVLILLEICAGGLLLVFLAALADVLLMLLPLFIGFFIAIAIAIVLAVKLNRLAGWLKARYGVSFAAFMLLGFVPPLVVYGSLFLYVACYSQNRSVDYEGVFAFVGTYFGAMLVLDLLAVSVVLPSLLLIEKGIELLVNGFPVKEKKHLHNPYLEIGDVAPIEGTVVRNLGQTDLLIEGDKKK